MGNSGNLIGKTRDAGWQIGLKRTLPFQADQVWEWMLSSAGADVW